MHERSSFLSVMDVGERRFSSDPCRLVRQVKQFAS
jgi:hypothetical protein